MKNEAEVTLNVEMEFKKNIDMTEFLEQTFKVGDFEEARKNYIKSKLPNKEFIKGTILNFQKEVENLGFKTMKNVSYANELTLERAFYELLKNKIQGDLQ
jgi:hypothetical protein